MLLDKPERWCFMSDIQDPRFGSKIRMPDESNGLFGAEKEGRSLPEIHKTGSGRNIDMAR